MWQREQLVAGWLPRAPRWTAALLCGLVIADLGHSAWALRSASNPGLVERPLLQRPRVSPFNVEPIVAAHLFGATAVSDVAPDAANAPETRLAFALSGIIATKDPSDGFAILGEQGKPAHLYRVGATVESTRGRLFRVFVDRVVLDFDGRQETLVLPRSLLPGISYKQAGTETVAAAEAPVAVDPRQRSLAQSAFGSLFAEPHNINGEMVGLVLHPARKLQRQYGFQDGDLLVAVNGVEISDPDALQNMLANSSEKTLSLTFTRDGVQQTKTLPVSN
jgi:general secretion pathway protein C